MDFFRKWYYVNIIQDFAKSKGLKVNKVTDLLMGYSLPELVEFDNKYIYKIYYRDNYDKWGERDTISICRLKLVKRLRL